MRDGDSQIDYRTHILVGVRTDGVMTMIEDWPHVPTQFDVQEAIDGTRGTYGNFALCTPTSVLPGKRGVEEKKVPSRFGLPGRYDVRSAQLLGEELTHVGCGKAHGLCKVRELASALSRA